MWRSLGKLQRRANFYQVECESAKAHIAVWGGDIEHYILWLCRNNKFKGRAVILGPHNLRVFGLCLSPVATEPILKLFVMLKGM